MTNRLAWNTKPYYEFTDIEAIRKDIENGCDVNAQFDHGFTPLHFAVRSNRPNVVRLLLDSGADPDVKDRWARKPVTLALEVKAFSEIYDMLKAVSDYTSPTDPQTGNLLPYPDMYHLAKLAYRPTDKVVNSMSDSELDDFIKERQSVITELANERDKVQLQLFQAKKEASGRFDKTVKEVKRKDREKKALASKLSKEERVVLDLHKGGMTKELLLVTLPPAGKISVEDIESAFKKLEK